MPTPHRPLDAPAPPVFTGVGRRAPVLLAGLVWAWLAGPSAWARDPIMELLAARGALTPAAAAAAAPAAGEAPPSGPADAPPPFTPAAPAPSDGAMEARSAALVYAMAYVGVPYRRGGTGFEEGVDCSGFVQVTFRETLGVVLPRRAAEQAQATLPIDPAQLAPGDLVFFNTQGEPFSHVGIYVGQGRFVHSPRSGAQVRLERLGDRYWRERFDGARRVVGGDSRG